MGEVIASITTSVDRYVTGPDDGVGCHVWVMLWPGQMPSGRLGGVVVQRSR